MATPIVELAILLPVIVLLAIWVEVIVLLAILVAVTAPVPIVVTPPLLMVTSPVTVCGAAGAKGLKLPVR